MNATKYLNSRLGKTIEQIKKAYLSGRHIYFLVCSEPEFIKDLLCSESFFPNLKSSPNTDGSIKFMGENDHISSNVFDNLDSPLLFIWTGNDNGVHIPIEDLTNYVNKTTTLSYCNKVVKPDENKKLLLLRQSLILVVVRSKPEVPTYIEPYSAIITVPLMNEAEFKELVSGYLEETESITTTTDTNGYKRVSNDHYLTKLYQNMRGLNATQVINILKKNQIALGYIYYDEKYKMYKSKLNALINNIKHEFEQLIDTSRALSLEVDSDKRPAGLDKMIEWIEKIKDHVSNPNDFRSYLLESPKGLIVSGVPGSGKSMMAKYIANIMNLSLVKFDLGNVGGGYVGDSERNMDEALDLIDSISPCILWIDEIEKAFTINNSSHETTLRVFGKFLTWIQEKSSCFIFATSNDISKMPPELFRSGRFDGKFFTFMPTADECAQIFESTISQEVDDYQSDRSGDSQSKSGDSQPKPLFNLDIINGAWFKDFINDNCLLGFPEGIDDTSVNKLNKFFIGADIVQLIKMAKIEYLQDKGGDEDEEDAIFDSNKFKECLKKALKELKTYGETDLDKIAKCYAQLAVNNFSSASKGMILPFEGYDDLGYKADSENKNRLYDLNRGLGRNDAETVHDFKELKCNYDKCLYIIVRNTINKIAVEIINNVKRI